MFNTSLYAQAHEKIKEKYLLTNIVAMRTRQLINGAEPLVDAEDMGPMDIALKEIIEGQVSVRKPEVVDEESLFG